MDSKSKSTAVVDYDKIFEEMDEMDFSVFYSDTIDVILANFMDVKKDEIDRMVDEVLGFS